MLPVPPFPTGSVPVTPVVSGRPVALVRTAVEGVPRLGVVRTGDVERTTEPDPVEVVTPVPPLATGSVPETMTLVEEAWRAPTATVLRPVPPSTTGTGRGMFSEGAGKNPATSHPRDVSHLAESPGDVVTRDRRRGDVDLTRGGSVDHCDEVFTLLKNDVAVTVERPIR